MKLKEVTISANTGLDAIKRAPIVDYDTGLKCIRIQDISQGKDFDEWGDTKTTNNDYKKYRLQIDDLLIARTGATVGVSFLVKKNYNAVFNNGSIRLRFDKRINPSFIYYIFKTSSFRQYIDNVSCVATQPNLRVENLLRFSIPNYGIEQQNEIVDYLEQYDLAVDNNIKRIRILEQMAENLYKEWFVRFRFPGYEDVEFDGRIPERFEFKKLSDICSFIRGVSYSSDQIDNENFSDYLINLKNMRDYGGFRKENYKLYGGEYKAEQIVNRFDLVMAITEMVQERRIIGYTGLVSSYNNLCVISADLLKIQSDYNNLFLYSLFTYGGGSKCFSQYGNGTNVIHLKPSSIENVKMLVPDKQLVDKYVELVRPIFDEIDNLQLQNENMIKQRDLLLPRLMSGKLQVK